MAKPRPEEMSQAELEAHIDKLIELGEHDRDTLSWQRAHSEWERREGL